MAFRVEIAPRAFDDLDRIASCIAGESSFDAAEKWFDGMIEAISSLDQLPTRCPIAGESRELGTEIGLLLHGRRNRAYKIYFAVCPDESGSGVVRILHVRHWARCALSSGELRELMGAGPAAEEAT